MALRQFSLPAIKFRKIFTPPSLWLIKPSGGGLDPRLATKILQITPSISRLARRIPFQMTSLTKSQYTWANKSKNNFDQK